MKKAKTAPQGPVEDVCIQEFLDMIAPSIVKFNTDHFICGNTFRCVWAFREYPTTTDEQAILSHLGEKDGVTLRNITNIMAAKEDLIYKALQVAVARQHRWCRPVEQRFLDEINSRRPQTLDQVKRIWYNGGDRSHAHYDDSRYHCLNLHSVFQKGTVEFRLFNGTLHAGKIKAYIQLCLAIGAQALNQRNASRTKTQTTNEKYTFRTWLLRLDLIGDEFKTARLYLLEHLDGCMAWRDPA